MGFSDYFWRFDNFIVNFGKFCSDVEFLNTFHLKNASNLVKTHDGVHGIAARLA